MGTRAAVLGRGRSALRRVGAGAKAGATVYVSDDELRDYKRRVQAMASDLFRRVVAHINKKWGPDGYSSATPAFKTPDDAKKYYAERAASKAFWQPFFALYTESACTPTPATDDSNATCQPMISNADHGLVAAGRWPQFVSQAFYPETDVVKEGGFLGAMTGDVHIRDELLGQPKGTFDTSERFRDIAKFEVEFKGWSDQLNGIVTGKLVEDSTKTSPVSTNPSKDVVDKAVKDAGGATGLAALPSIPPLGGLGDGLGSLVTLAGIGVVLYFGLQAFSAFTGKASEAKSSARAFRSA